MSINRVFLACMVLVGAAVGIVLVIHPESRDLRLSPYFWVLIAMAAFELIAFARGRGAPGTVVSMDARLAGVRAGDRADGGDPDRGGLAGSLLAIVLMVAIPIVADSPARLF